MSKTSVVLLVVLGVIGALAIGGKLAVDRSFEEKRQAEADSAASRARAEALTRELNRGSAAH